MLMWACLLGAGSLVLAEMAFPTGGSQAGAATSTSVAVTYQVNAVHDGAQSSESLAPPLTRQWSAAFDNAVSYPVVVGGRAFVTTRTGLTAVDAATGAKLWTVDDSSAHLAYDNGRLFMVNRGGLLRAFNPATGKELWRTQLATYGPSVSPPTATNGMVYVSIGSQTLSAVSELDGHVVWQGNVENGDESSPAVTADAVYVSYTGPQAYRFDPNTGAQLWWHKGTTEGGGGVTPVYHDGQVYAGGVRLDSASGAEVGRSMSALPPAFDHGWGFFALNRLLFGEDAATGTVLWRYDAGSVIADPPVVANGYVYILAENGTLTVLRETSGEVAWSGATGATTVVSYNGTTGDPVSGLAIAQGMLFVPTADGHLFAYAGTGASGCASSPCPNPTVTTRTSTGQGLPSDIAPNFLVDAAHSMSQPNDPVTPPLTRSWDRNLGGIVRYPLIADGKVFIDTRPQPGTGALLYAIDLRTGLTDWGPLDLGGGADIAYDQGTIIVVGADNFVQGLDASTGKQRWAFTPTNQVYFGPPTASAGSVYSAGTGEAEDIYAVDTSTGALRWDDFASAGAGTLPAVSGGSVFVGSSCFAAAAAVANGAQQWYVNRGCGSGGFSNTPAVAAGRVYIRDEFGDVILDATDGSNLGTFTADGPPALTPTTGFFFESHVLHARDLSTMNDKWTFAGDGQLVSGPLVAGGSVYVGSGSGKLYALEQGTGRVVWTDTADAPFIDAREQAVDSNITPAAGEGYVVFPDGGHLVAYTTAAANQPSTTTTTAPRATTTTANTPTTRPTTTTAPTTTTTTTTGQGSPGAPTPGTSATQSSSATPSTERYWLLEQDGAVHAFGDTAGSDTLGPAAGNGSTAVSIASTPAVRGYWSVTTTGDVTATDQAKVLGALPVLAPNETVRSIAATPDGAGYWLFTSIGRVLPYGTATFLGDLRNVPLNAPTSVPPQHRLAAATTSSVAMAGSSRSVTPSSGVQRAACVSTRRSQRLQP